MLGVKLRLFVLHAQEKKSPENLENNVLLGDCGFPVFCSGVESLDCSFHWLLQRDATSKGLTELRALLKKKKKNF